MTETLLRWYDENKRTFTFRGNRDPYRVWLSEIMLQQTRTETVEGYYSRFLAAFPDVQALARAQEEAVLKAWEGLGYYSRARNLLRAARIVVRDMDGAFPSTAQGLQQLPGIGPYTAAAVASICFDEPVPAMDGNLNRVISRLYNIEEDITTPTVKRRLYQLALGLMPQGRPGDMNQALMDLGATVCLPGTPDCARCPLQAYCLAFLQGEPERLPVLPRKKPPREVDMAVVMVTCGDRVLVFRRREALLRGLYVFLLLEGEQEARRPALHLKRLGFQRHVLQGTGKARHVFTHRVWQMTLYRARVSQPLAVPGGEWVPLSALPRLPFPTAMAAALGVLEDGWA